MNSEIKILEKNHSHRMRHLQYMEAFKNKNRIKNVRTVINQTSKLRHSINTAAFAN